MDFITVVAATNVGFAVAVAGPDLRRWWRHRSRDALLRAGFAALTAVIAVAAAVAFHATDPAAKHLAATARGCAVLGGFPLLLHVIGAAIDRHPPRWLLGLATAVAVVGVVLAVGTDLYVAGATTTGVGPPEVGPAYRPLVAAVGAVLVVWGVAALRLARRWSDRLVLACGIGLPAVGAVLALAAPSLGSGPRNLTWLALLLLVELTRWRAVRQEEQLREALFAGHQRLTSELVEANERLRDVVRTRSELIDVASHELRTPITVIKGLVEVVQQRDHQLDTVTRLHLLERVAANADRLHITFEQLATARHLATDDTTRASPVAVPLAAAVDLTLDHLAAGRDTVVVDVPPHIEVAADPTDLQVALAALVVNALEHGRPPVRIEARAEGGGCRLRVTDAGDGVPDELRHAVFEQFVQGSRGHGRVTGGVGLGLSNAAALARRNGGELVLSPEHAATFELTLPLADPVDVAQPQTDRGNRAPWRRLRPHASVDHVAPASGRFAPRPR